jgi:hypothetical protein
VVQEIITRIEATPEGFNFFFSIGSFMCILLKFCFGENTTRDQEVILLQERIITSCGLQLFILFETKFLSLVFKYYNIILVFFFTYHLIARIVKALSNPLLKIICKCLTITSQIDFPKF